MAPTALLNLSIVALVVSVDLLAGALIMVIRRPMLALSVDLVVTPVVRDRLPTLGPLIRFLGSELNTLRLRSVLLKLVVFFAVPTTLVSVVRLISARVLTSVAWASERNLLMPTCVTDLELDVQSAIALMPGGPLLLVVVVIQLLVNLLGTTMTRLI